MGPPHENSVSLCYTPAALTVRRQIPISLKPDYTDEYCWDRGGVTEAPYSTAELPPPPRTSNRYPSLLEVDPTDDGASTSKVATRLPILPPPTRTLKKSQSVVQLKTPFLGKFGIETVYEAPDKGNARVGDIGNEFWACGDFKNYYVVRKSRVFPNIQPHTKLVVLNSSLPAPEGLCCEIRESPAKPEAVACDQKTVARGVHRGLLLQGGDRRDHGHQQRRPGGGVVGLEVPGLRGVLVVHARLPQQRIRSGQVYVAVPARCHCGGLHRYEEGGVVNVAVVRAGSCQCHSGGLVHRYEEGCGGDHVCGSSTGCYVYYYYTGTRDVAVS